MTSATGSMSKVDMIDRELRTRYGVTLAQWVEHKLNLDVTWRKMERDLQEAINADQRPISRQGLMRWWRTQEDSHDHG